VGPRFKSPNFLCVVLFLMAVAMGVVAAATFFWLYMPDPAMVVLITACMTLVSLVS
jgi:hypothetical protein